MDIILRLKIYWNQYWCKHSYDRKSPRLTERTIQSNGCYSEVKFYDCQKCFKEIVEGSDMIC